MSEIEQLLANVVMNATYPPSDVDILIAGFIREIGPIPHKDYLIFMREHNGCDGPIGHNGNISIWPLEEVVLWTEQYRVSEQAPGLLLFGSDGGNEGFAFDRQEAGWPIVSVPLIGMSRKEMKFVAATFTEFIKRLAADDLPI